MALPALFGVPDTVLSPCLYAHFVLQLASTSPVELQKTLFVGLWIVHAVSIVPDVADTFPCLLVLACVVMERLHQGFQAAPIEFIIARLDPWLAFQCPHK